METADLLELRSLAFLGEAVFSTWLSAYSKIKKHVPKTRGLNEMSPFRNVEWKGACTHPRRPPSRLRPGGLGTAPAARGSTDLVATYLLSLLTFCRYPNAVVTRLLSRPQLTADTCHSAWFSQLLEWQLGVHKSIPSGFIEAVV